MNKNKKVKQAALKEIRELKRKTETQSCKPKHGSFLTTQEVPQSACCLQRAIDKMSKGYSAAFGHAAPTFRKRNKNQ